MRLIIRTFVVGAALSLLAPGSALAVTLGFTCTTSNSPANCLLGQAQFSVGIEEGYGGRLNLKFRNLGPEPSSIARIYFDGAPTLASIYKVVNYAGTAFVEGGSPATLPGWREVSPTFVTDHYVTAAKPEAHLGINPGEQLKIVMLLGAGSTFDTVLADIASGAIRIGIHTVGWADGNSDAFLNGPPRPPVVPEPPLIALFGGALFLLARQIQRRARRLEGRQQ